MPRPARRCRANCSWEDCCTRTAAGGYLPTRRFHQYALACVVAPLSRARAKGLIDRACGLAARINADSARNPFQIKFVAVSGNYMSSHDQLAELSLWLVLDRAPVRRRAACDTFAEQGRRVAGDPGTGEFAQLVHRRARRVG